MIAIKNFQIRSRSRLFFFKRDRKRGEKFFIDPYRNFFKRDPVEKVKRVLKNS